MRKNKKLKCHYDENRPFCFSIIFIPIEGQWLEITYLEIWNLSEHSNHHKFRADFRKKNRPPLQVCESPEPVILKQRLSCVTSMTQLLLWSFTNSHRNFANVFRFRKLFLRYFFRQRFRFFRGKYRVCRFFRLSVWWICRAVSDRKGSPRVFRASCSWRRRGTVGREEKNRRNRP